MPFQRVSAQHQAADQHTRNEEERVRFGVRERKFHERKNDKSHAEQHPIIPSEARSPIYGAGANVDGNCTDDSDCIEACQRVEIGGAQNNDDQR